MDAVIVQDVGVAKIAKEVVRKMEGKYRLQQLQWLELSEGRGNEGRKILLGKGLDGSRMEIHASTQQTVTCADGVAFSAERTNATRVVRAWR